MPDSAASSSLAPVVYQLRVVVRGISPLIWRRLLVRSDTTIADLHRTLQLAFGRSDEHLHRFVIHGHVHGAESLIDPHRVRLADLGLRLKERLVDEYDFIDGWQHDVRLEQVLPLDSQRRYPVCIGGGRAAPPEDCGGGLWAFLELRQHYSIVTIADRMLALLSPLVAAKHNDVDEPVNDAGDDNGDDPGDEDAHDPAQELTTLLRWLQIDRCDRRAANRDLARLELTPARAVA